MLVQERTKNDKSRKREPKEHNKEKGNGEEAKGTKESDSIKRSEEGQHPDQSDYNEMIPKITKKIKKKIPKKRSKVKIRWKRNKSKERDNNEVDEVENRRAQENFSEEQIVQSKRQMEKGENMTMKSIQEEEDDIQQERGNGVVDLNDNDNMMDTYNSRNIGEEMGDYERQIEEIDRNQEDTDTEYEENQEHQEHMKEISDKNGLSPMRRGRSKHRKEKHKSKSLRSLRSQSSRGEGRTKQQPLNVSYD
ncbi:hypothetical protein K7X08_014399 [Anisodus acutangulus]|uniref:Uncharacterized protein n=1 Tax=Anisodus acutangulus TaxID=402998 RepID=A0A9Q1LJR3_9SOLA|nr:hypothetical protein K7X08_014399 [Anisodus acutangulus]